MIYDKGKDYKVVSLPSGATSYRSIQDNYDWIISFEDVVLALDQDAAGRKGTSKICSILPLGKTRVMSFKDYKDINEILLAKDPKTFWSALYNAKEYRPDGIIRLSQAWDELWKNDNIDSIPYPWAGMNEKLYGLRPHEIVTFTSGSGLGKSAIMRELEHYLFKVTKDNIGILALEENIGRTAWGIMSIEANKPLHIREERKNTSGEDIRKYWDATIGTGRFIAYDHFGSTSEDNLLNQVRYMVKAMECRWIILDHLSIVVSAMDEGGDERRTIDSIMTKLRTLTEETGAGLLLVTHLRRVGDKGHEQGIEVTLNHLRGSQSISHLSDAVVALERNQQSENEKEANLTLLRVLKNRYAGYVGPAGYLYYNRPTGRLIEIEDKEEFLSDEEF
jgi:twinkle protein